MKFVVILTSLLLSTAVVAAELPLGAVLPGTEVRSLIITGEPPPASPAARSEAYTFQETSQHVNIEALDPSKVVFARTADAVFNGEDAAYRISFYYSHFGLNIADAGDINGHGITDLLVTDHFAWVDGVSRAGEVDLYFGRRDGIDPRQQVPNVIFYGESQNGKLGFRWLGAAISMPTARSISR